MCVAVDPNETGSVYTSLIPSDPPELLDLRALKSIGVSSGGKPFFFVCLLNSLTSV